MKYKSFNLTNFIGLKYFKPESIAEIKGENEKYKRLKKKEALKQTHAKITTRHCAKCKSKCEINAENYVYSYSEKRKEYRKLFLCENCLMKCKSCNKTGNDGFFVYIWNKSKNDYGKLFYCMDCYKKAKLNYCKTCKRIIDSLNKQFCCVVCQNVAKIDNRSINIDFSNGIFFTKECAEKVKNYLFQKKVIENEILVLADINEARNRKMKDVYEILFEKKQKNGGLYTRNPVEVRKIFAEGELLKLGCADGVIGNENVDFYILKNQFCELENLKSSGYDWPVVLCNSNIKLENLIKNQNNSISLEEIVNKLSKTS